MGEGDFNEFMRLGNQLVIAAKNFAREENLSPAVMPRLSKDMIEQLKLADKVVDVFDRASRKNFVTVQRYSVDKPESSYAKVRIFAGKKEEEKFQQFVYVNFEFEEFIYLFHVMNSVCDKIIAN